MFTDLVVAPTLNVGVTTTTSVEVEKLDDDELGLVRESLEFAVGVSVVSTVKMYGPSESEPDFTELEDTPAEFCELSDPEVTG